VWLLARLPLLLGAAFVSALVLRQMAAGRRES